MANVEGIFSIRLVIADFYIEKPVLGLDPCYSEFRGKEIKRVPVIRIFGSNAAGQKTCMHVHGVFPYFYIPYDKKDFETPQKAFYQVATNLDKAINISLGQGSSQAQHVFKVQLVKGIPFYGYHRSEHQYLKIHMFNPRFVRRAANLLQNGAILNKNFLPHESHVPYMLQFMIDYNLYGMSFMHVPLDIVKFRCNNEHEDIPFLNLTAAQILSNHLVKKQSISSLEVDIAASFILNRFQLSANNTHVDKNQQTNPGVEAIWHDERVRRQKLMQEYANDEEKLKKIPALEVPPPDERPPMQMVESEIFYQTGLESKLQAMETILSASESMVDETLNNTTIANNSTLQPDLKNASREQKRHFNLNKILANSVYPEECPDESRLLNASYIENHLSNKSIFQANIAQNLEQLQSSRENPPLSQPISEEEERDFLENTIIDEELVLSLTQQPYVPLNATLRENDVELLELLQQLESENGIENEEVDLDSTLAPLKEKEIECSPEWLDKETIANIMNEPFSDEEYEAEHDQEENALDFTMAMDDIDELLLKLNPSQQEIPSPSKPPTTTNKWKSFINLPQLDGADDAPKTPKKLNNMGNMFKDALKTPTHTPKLKLAKSPNHSPRTPKRNAASKYTPLPLIIKSVKKNLDESEADKPATTVDPHKNLLNSLRLLQQQFVLMNQKPNVQENFPKEVKNIEKEDVPEKVKEKETDSGIQKPEEEEPKNVTPIIRRARKTMDLDRTLITCNLIPRRRSERILKVYPTEEKTENKVVKKRGRVKKVEVEPSIEKKEVLENPLVQQLKQLQKLMVTAEQQKTAVEQSKANNESEDEEIINSDGESVAEISLRQRRSCHFKRLRRSLMVKETKRMKIEQSLHETSLVKKCKVRLKRLQIIPKKTPSSVKKCRVRVKRLKLETKTSNSQIELKRREVIPRSPSVLSTGLESFSPSVFSDIYSQRLKDFSPSLTMDLKFTEEEEEEVGNKLKDYSPSIPLELKFSEEEEDDDEEEQKEEVVNEEQHIIKPLLNPPTREEVLEMCHQLEMFEHEYQNPFYSAPDDVGGMKEVGFTVLKIPGNKLNDLPEFESFVASQIKNAGLLQWRREQLKSLGGMSVLQKLKTTQRIREYCAAQKKVWIVPQLKPPSRHEAKLWLKARELLQDKEEAAKKTVQVDEDSPIKLRRQKITMMLAGENGDENGEEDLECSILTLTPITPSTPLNKSQRLNNTADTPLTVSSEILSGEKRSQKRGVLKHSRAKLSLTAKLKAAVDAEIVKDEETKLKLSAAGSSSMPGSQHSESSFNSDVVLAALERSSFMKNLRSQSRGALDSSLSNLDNTFGFKVNLENLQEAKADVECNYLTTMTLEIFVPTRDDLYPNPQIDEIRCIFYAIENNVPDEVENCLPQKACGYIMLQDSRDLVKNNASQGLDPTIEVQLVKSELEAFEALLALVSHWDPDIYAGYEIEMNSWGYLLDRAKYLSINMAPMLSRIPTQKIYDYKDEENELMNDVEVETKLSGRILLDVWRLMRSEIALMSYTFENVMYHIMHKRYAWHSYRDLTQWYITPGMRWIVMEYYIVRVRGTLALLDQLDLIGRTAEMAKLIGIQFYEVLSRGSQFRVESMMLRIAKPKNLVPLSPSVQQRAHMRAPEYLSLIMEPESRFYADPLIVLDFQSLYPSVIIAYNYCFSTCLGRVEHLGKSTPFEFGAGQLRVSPKMLKKLLERDLVTISPCGVVFVKSSVREGVLPRMLTEILDTRQMVKQSMKVHKNNSALQRILHSRQLGLKLMANVTYGYTAANFSGRMPSVEVGDSVVSKGRETLERAIQMVEANEKWKVRVVYGDTDSLFVLVPGRSRAQAFQIGEEIVEAVTKANPFPIKLKLEKVYQPCILQTKKRYVGYMYETADQAEPVYEAKGIETVRRDGCPLVAKMLEKVLRILFETTDVSQVKRYVCRQFTKLLSGQANLQDLIYAKEFRGLNGYKPTACVPALEMTRKWIQSDPRHIPRRGERVPYIIINGPPGVPLIRMVRCPRELLNDAGLKINAIYYITKAIIPPLNRCLLLIGADVNDWFASLPRHILLGPVLGTGNELIPNLLVGDGGSTHVTKKSTISQYFSTSNCVLQCGRQTKKGICGTCAKQPSKCHIVLQTKISRLERSYRYTEYVCQACCGRSAAIRCGSLDCPVLYVLETKHREMQQINYYKKLLNELN